MCRSSRWCCFYLYINARTRQLFIKEMFCPICLFGMLLSSFLEEDLCDHDTELTEYTIRQYGFENPLRPLLMGITGRNESTAWIRNSVGHRFFRLKRNRSSEHAAIKFQGQWFNLGRILRGQSSISSEFRNSMKFLAAQQIRYASREEFNQHIHSHQLTVNRSNCQYENMYNRSLALTVRKTDYGDSLAQITKTFFKCLSRYNLRFPPNHRTLNLMTFGYYSMCSFKFID